MSRSWCTVAPNMRTTIGSAPAKDGNRVKAPTRINRPIQASNDGSVKAKVQHVAPAALPRSAATPRAWAAGTAAFTAATARATATWVRPLTTPPHPSLRGPGRWRSRCRWLSRSRWPFCRKEIDLHDMIRVLKKASFEAIAIPVALIETGWYLPQSMISSPRPASTACSCGDWTDHLVELDGRRHREFLPAHQHFDQGRTFIVLSFSCRGASPVLTPAPATCSTRSNK